MTQRTHAPSTTKQPRFDPDATRLDLIITGESLFLSQPLPATGELVIGRAADADVRVDHPSVSREHAVLRIGAPITIEDLGSANGTRLRGRPLAPRQPIEIQPGEVVDLGSVLLVVQPRPRAKPARRVWTHDYFEGRVEEECVRAGRTGGRFAILQIAALANADPVQDGVLGVLGDEDVLGAYAPGNFEILVLDVDAAAAERLARKLATAAARHGTVLRTGVALYPRDGTSAHALLAHALAEVTQGVVAERGTPESRGEPRPEPHGEAHPEPRGELASSTMTDLHRLAECVAAGTISVLVLGETGAGKEVLAETIHRLSPRRAAAFLRLNCAALSETLLESELFGHERGAFTGAMQSKPGLLETADGGTVFLDEVGELAMATQVKLLRVLEEREVLRVGGLKPRSIDVRFIAATNRDLEAEIERKTFRQDLYFRLSAATLVIPPLRERVSEIAGLARAFVDTAARAMGRPAPALAPDVLPRLEAYAWPGNIRELRNMMERAVLLCGQGPIRLAHLPVEKMRATLAPRRTVPTMQIIDPVPARTLALSTSAPLPVPGEDRPLRDAVRAQVEALEKQRICDALARVAGNQSAAAKLLGMPRRTLVKRLAAYNIPRPRRGSGDA
jgi:two-component system, NtrC family, response regulator AtoC